MHRFSVYFLVSFFLIGVFWSSLMTCPRIQKARFQGSGPFGCADIVLFVFHGEERAQPFKDSFDIKSQIMAQDSLWAMFHIAVRESHAGDMES